MRRSLKHAANDHQPKMRWHTARRYRNAQLALNCRDELLVIADYRRSEETALLLAETTT